MPDERQRNAKVSVALRRIDVINHFEFPDGERILRQATSVAPRIARLKKRAHDVGIPTVYVDDNFGDWRSDAARLLAYCLRPEAAGRAFVEKIKSDPEDYFVLKPMHSAFYQTPLDVPLSLYGQETRQGVMTSTNFDVDVWTRRAATLRCRDRPYLQHQTKTEAGTAH